VQKQQTTKTSKKTGEVNHPPRIVKTNPPEQKIELFVGAEASFSAEATDSDPDDELTYTWTLDGQQESEGNIWRYKTQSEGKHTVLLNVIDSGGLKAQRSWLVITNAPPAKCITLEDNSELCMPEP
jgi:hypothetical protein